MEKYRGSKNTRQSFHGIRQRTETNYQAIVHKPGGQSKHRGKSGWDIVVESTANKLAISKGKWLLLGSHPIANRKQVCVAE